MDTPAPVVQYYWCNVGGEVWTKGLLDVSGIRDTEGILGESNLEGKVKQFCEFRAGGRIGFLQEGSYHRVAFKTFGTDELFQGGCLDLAPGVGKPWLFW